MDVRSGIYNIYNSLRLDTVDRAHMSYYDGCGGASLKYAIKLVVTLGGTALYISVSKTVCSNLSTQQAVGA